MSERVKAKIVKLLRLAQDQVGTPEGETAQKMAHEMMATHGLDVDVDDVEFEGTNEVVHHVVAQMDERTWWMEMLLVTLCDLYGGEAVVMVGPPFRLHVVLEPEDDIDIAVLQRHFGYLSQLIEDLCHACAPEFMRAPPEERDKAISSFCIGAVYRISQMLYRHERHEDVDLDLEQMPFMIRALAGHVEAPTEKKEPGAVWRPEPSMEHRVHDDLVEIIPQWSWFDVGYRHAQRLIVEPYP